MSGKFPEYKPFDLSSVTKQMLQYWEQTNAFEQSLKNRADSPEYIFYEGPPSANGMPGIHHVISRTVKDIFCRYKTMKGYRVERKAGWDTHGLPVELAVERSLGITKDEIGKKVSIEEYNKTCRKEVMKYTSLWEELTKLMGYWVDMSNPYITYDNRYIETLWYLLSQLFEKGLLYKGYSIQPFSPAAGTGLSTHELNQPGCYRDVTDTTCVAQFNIIRDSKSAFLFAHGDPRVCILAWTTTPWTLPSNTALAVGPDITYVKVRTRNLYSGEKVCVILAKNRLSAFFSPDMLHADLEIYQAGDKKLPYEILDEFQGKQLAAIRYEQLIDWVKPAGKAFYVVEGDFVTTEDGTGIVHIAPTFGADDHKVARQNDIASLLVVDSEGCENPLVDRKGRFFPLENLDPGFVASQVNTATYTDFAGRYVKSEYEDFVSADATSIDVDIAVSLKKQNKAFKIEKHVHSYPHCWRTHKPVLYYPLDSWFVRVTALRERMVELNNTINWKPESTGSGRFGKWLENLQDWNLSRSRYWGTPLPVWSTEDQHERLCIGSVAQLKSEIAKSVAAGFMSVNPLDCYRDNDYSPENYEQFDLHRPFIDEVILVSPSGKRMFREKDLIDVWFDSGAMPYAQLHYPFACGEEELKKRFPADFIAEGVDQTRGWFYTLHALAVMLFDSVAFKNIVSNGLVLDDLGRKMSKNLGNVIPPVETIEKHGTDTLRWYMIAASQPWDNLKFDMDGVEEVKRKFFGTLYNTYSFFALYANVDGFVGQEEEVPLAERPEIDRWIISLLNTLIREVTDHYDHYEPTLAARAIQHFVTENLSNWYVRLNRKRYWGGTYSTDKVAAYQTLYTCLDVVARLSAPIAPFYADKLFLDLNGVTGKNQSLSVHHATFPVCIPANIDNELEARMLLAQNVSSMVLSLRRKCNTKVRQPLQKIILPVVDTKLREHFEVVKNLVLTEVNIKEVEYMTDTSGLLVKRIKPNFKTLGPRYGKLMKGISQAVGEFSQKDIRALETSGKAELAVEDQSIEITLADVEITSEDIPGWLVATEGNLTVALDITVTNELKMEGIAREIINRVQNIRKDSAFNVTDKINLYIENHAELADAVERFSQYIGEQVLANSIELSDGLNENNGARSVELDDDFFVLMKVEKANS